MNGNLDINGYTTQILDIHNRSSVDYHKVHFMYFKN